jgi:glyoxylase-like metal-dependent hydrolase (beta-lactamase superfamily II)
MAPGTEIVQISASLQCWHAYDANIKADLFSTAITTSEGLLIVDPIPVDSKIFQKLAGARPIVGIVVTNVNHCRAAKDFAKKFGAPIFGNNATIAACELSQAREITNGQTFATGVCAIKIEGAAAGEMAIYHELDGGCLIIGDALINFEPYGFTFLPRKYCLNAKQMRRSLRHLLDYKFERMLFAHGTPLMHSAQKKLEQLLRDNE